MTQLLPVDVLLSCTTVAVSVPLVACLCQNALQPLAQKLDLMASVHDHSWLSRPLKCVSSSDWRLSQASVLIITVSHIGSELGLKSQIPEPF